MENKELCRQCKGQCCKNGPGKFDCLPENWRERLGKDLVIGIDICLGPEFIKEMVGGSLLLKDPKIMMDVDLFKLLKEMGLTRKGAIAGFFFFVRPKGKGDVYKIGPVNREVGNRCTFHNNKYGCMLAYENRPYECRELVPNKVLNRFECSTEGVRLEIAKRMVPVQGELLEEVKRIVKEMDGEIDPPTLDLIESMRENGFI